MALPAVLEEHRFEVTALGAPGCYSVLLRIGFGNALDRNATFLDALVGAIAEDIRFRACVAKCALSSTLPSPGAA